MSNSETLEDLSREDTANRLRKELKSMKGVLPSNKSVALSVLKAIPFFNRVLSSLNRFGNSINNVVKIEGYRGQGISEAAEAFEGIRIISTIIDLFRIPFVFLAAKIAGQKLPFTVSNNARFIYSVITLALTITALLVPPAGLIIGVVSALFGLALSAVTLARLYFSRGATCNKLLNIEKQIKQKEADLLDLINELAGSKKDLELCEHQAKLHLDILQELHNKKEFYKHKLKHLGTGKAIDKGIGVIFSCVGLIGVLLNIFVPVVGLSIFLALSIGGVAYVAWQMGYHLYKFYEKKAQLVKDEEIELQELTHHFEDPEIKKEALRLKNLIPEDPKLKSRIQEEVDRIKVHSVIAQSSSLNPVTCAQDPACLNIVLDPANESSDVGIMKVNKTPII
jgi:hypothetical protein